MPRKKRTTPTAGDVLEMVEALAGDLLAAADASADAPAQRRLIAAVEPPLRHAADALAAHLEAVEAVLAGHGEGEDTSTSDDTP
jgi:hypothetical protein